MSQNGTGEASAGLPDSGPPGAPQGPQEHTYVVSLRSADGRGDTRTRLHRELTRCLSLWFGDNVTVEEQ